MGTCHCLPYYVHLVHTRTENLSSVVVLHHGGLSDETTSLGTMATATASQLQPFKFSSTWTTSARRMPFSRAARVWSHRENCKDFGSNRISNSLVQRIPRDCTPRYPTATLTRSQGMVFLFRWPCYQIQVNTPVDVWSNHACQVALFFPSINTACSSRSVRSCPASELLAQVGGSVNTRSSPASRKCTPRQPT